MGFRPTARDLLFAVISLLAVWMILKLIEPVIPRAPQPQDYHDFADKRSVQIFDLKIPNFFDVSSNLSFLVFGAQGIVLLLRHHHTRQGHDAKSRRVIAEEEWEYKAWLAWFTGVFLTACTYQS